MIPDAIEKRRVIRGHGKENIQNIREEIQQAHR